MSSDPPLIHRTSAPRKPDGSVFGFQILYGIRRDPGGQPRRGRPRMRIYLPFGRQWFPYFLRRSGERPANVGFVLTGDSARAIGRTRPAAATAETAFSLCNRGNSVRSSDISSVDRRILLKRYRLSECPLETPSGASIRKHLSLNSLLSAQVIWHPS